MNKFSIIPFGRKYFHFRMAPEHVSNNLTGYEHNAVTPFAMNE